jgi:Leucine-rich repeat (LRR) protein
MDQIAIDIVAKWCKQPTKTLYIEFPLHMQGQFNIPPLPEGIRHLSICEPIKNSVVFPKSLRQLDIMHLYMGKLPELPDGLRVLYISDIFELQYLPPSLHKLCLCQPGIKSLPQLPKSLKHFQMDWSHIPRFSLSLPAHLRHLDVQYCEISEIDYLPPSLIYFCCENNYIKELPDLPCTLRVLKCSRNQLKYIPELPPNIRVLECGYNQLTCLPELPKSLDKVAYFGNNFAEEPIIPLTVRVVEGDTINYDRR